MVVLLFFLLVMILIITNVRRLIRLVGNQVSNCFIVYFKEAYAERISSVIELRLYIE